MEFRGLIGSDIIGIASSHGFMILNSPMKSSGKLMVYSFLKPRFNRVLDCLQTDLQHIEISCNRNVDDPFDEQLFNESSEIVPSEGFRNKIESLSQTWSNITEQEIETEAQAVISRRKGQEKYRRSQIELWEEKCALTGVAVLSLLNGSHAKAWQYSNDQERLDPFNGFLFEARIDRLFDKYLISFEDDGQILISKQLDLETQTLLGINSSMKLRMVYDQNLPYLRFHRDKFRKQEELFAHVEKNVLC